MRRVEHRSAPARAPRAGAPATPRSPAATRRGGRRRARRAGPLRHRPAAVEWAQRIAARHRRPRAAPPNRRGRAARARGRAPPRATSQGAALDRGPAVTPGAPRGAPRRRRDRPARAARPPGWRGARAPGPRRSTGRRRRRRGRPAPASARPLPRIELGSDEAAARFAGPAQHDRIERRRDASTEQAHGGIARAFRQQARRRGPGQQHPAGRQQPVDLAASVQVAQRREAAVEDQEREQLRLRAGDAGGRREQVGEGGGEGPPPLAAPRRGRQGVDRPQRTRRGLDGERAEQERRARAGQEEVPDPRRRVGPRSCAGEMQEQAALGAVGVLEGLRRERCGHARQGGQGPPVRGRRGLDALGHRLPGRSRRCPDGRQAGLAHRSLPGRAPRPPARAIDARATVAQDGDRRGGPTRPPPRRGP